MQIEPSNLGELVETTAFAGCGEKRLSRSRRIASRRGHRRVFKHSCGGVRGRREVVNQTGEIFLREPKRA